MRPGDAIIGDQDGVVVIPAAVAQDVSISRTRERLLRTGENELEQIQATEEILSVSRR